VSHARVQDVVPVPLAGFTWTCTANDAGAQCGTAAGSGDIDALVTLPAGTSATFTVSGTAPAATTETLTNTATVTPPLGVTDPVPGNNSATDNNPTGNTPSEVQADLAISKVGSPDPYVPGALLTYTIVVNNVGPSNVTNARVQDVLPAPLAGFTWTCTASGVGAECGHASGSGSIDALVTLPDGTSVTFTVSGTVPPGTTAALVNTATVTPPAEVTDPVPGNNSATSSQGATGLQADVAIIKSGPGSVGSDGALTYTLVVTNHGPAPADGAVVTDPAVANFNADTVSCGAALGGAVCPAAPTVAQLQAGLVIAVLPSGGSVTLTLSGTAAASGAITNVATVAPPAGVTDPTPDNDSSTADTIIAPGPTPAPIPTLNTAMLALLAVALWLLAARALARRRR
jgi:uncharacterized repeat protein (TIGR01451 family)